MLPGEKKSLAERLLLVIAFFAAAVAISYWLYKALHEPSPGSASAASNVIGEPGPAPSMSRTVQSHAEGAHQQAPDISRHSETRLTHVEDGRKIQTCHGALLQKKYMEKRNCDNLKAEDVVGIQLCSNALISDSAYLQQLSAITAGCPESLVNASDYYIALRDAAQTGDANAQQCFLAGYFNDPDAGDRISETQLNEYLSLARQFVQSAFERGDWSVVHYLADRPPHPGLLIQAYPFGLDHPDTNYRMNYLLTLGSGDVTGSDTARKRVNVIRSNGDLSVEQVQAAEVWARQTYANYFAATPYNEKAAANSFCQTDLK